MNKYYIELQNILTDRIRVVVAEMNKNVYELSNENKELQQRIDKAINYINMCIKSFDTNILNSNEIIRLIKILSDE